LIVARLFPSVWGYAIPLLLAAGLIVGAFDAMLYRENTAFHPGARAETTPFAAILERPFKASAPQISHEKQRTTGPEKVSENHNRGLGDEPFLFIRAIALFVSI